MRPIKKEDVRTGNVYTIRGRDSGRHKVYHITIEGHHETKGWWASRGWGQPIHIKTARRLRVLLYYDKRGLLRDND